jgi:hypothetical protein
MGHRKKKVVAAAGIVQMYSPFDQRQDECGDPDEKQNRGTANQHVLGPAIAVENFIDTHDSACMHAYVAKANMDVKRIQEVAAADMKQIAERANLSTKAIQNKADQASAEEEGVTADLNAQIAKITPSDGRHR